jgi:hypothetical protein
MKISKKRLIEIIEEECAGVDHSQIHQDIDEEGAMAKRQLHDMEKYARELSEMLQDTTQLESWVQAKLTKAADYLKTVKHYVEYGMEEGAYDQVMPEMSPIDPMVTSYDDSQSGNYDLNDDMITKMLEELAE